MCNCVTANFSCLF